ncbi:MAG: sigma-70 family RNA polymerase sigma factor [Terriglobales bacterium]|jgi:RNA polymerase sigma factor (sigma-70 family)
MNVHVSYRAAKAPEADREFNHHTEKLQRRLQVFRPELVHLHAIVAPGPVREGTSVSLTLSLPSGNMVAEDNGPTAVAAIKGAFQELLKQITKHKELLRSDNFRGARRLKRNGNGGADAQKFDESVAAVHAPKASGEDIHSYVNANLPRLERFVERELRYRETTGQVRPGLITREEVVDEVIARALGEDEEKPELLSLERWLYRLAIQGIQRLATQNDDALPSVRLEQSTRQQNVRASDEPVLQYHQPDETMNGEATIADTRIATPEQIAYTDEMVRMVEDALLKAPKEAREAFVLFAVEGFSLREIAAVADRKPEQVEQSIANAREFLIKNLPAPNPFAKKIIQHSKLPPLRGSIPA